jgi:rhodanese-related sulfurtransferase
MKIFISSIIAGALLLISCGSQTSQSHVGIIDVKNLESKLESKSPIQLIDVRTPAEVAAGAISGAINIDYLSGDFEAKISKLDRNKPYVVYCAKGSRSAQAVEKMVTLGFTNLDDLDGGYNAWIKLKQD